MNDKLNKLKKDCDEYKTQKYDFFNKYLIEIIHLLVFQNKEVLSIIKIPAKLGEKPNAENFNSFELIHHPATLGAIKSHDFLYKQESIKRIAYSVLMIFSYYLQNFGRQTCGGLVYMLKNHIHVSGKSKPEYRLTENIYLINLVLQKYSIFDLKMKQKFIKDINKLLINENCLRSFYSYRHAVAFLSDVLISYKNINEGNLYSNFHNLII